MTAEQSAFDRAADLILDTLEEAFGLVANPASGRQKTHRAVISILRFFATPKDSDGVKETEALFKYQVEVERARCARIVCEFIDGTGSESDSTGSVILARIIEGE